VAAGTGPVHLVYELVLGSCCEGGFGSERGARCEAEGEEEAAGAGGERVRGLACVHGGALARGAGGELEPDGAAGRSGRQLGEQCGVGSRRFVRPGEVAGRAGGGAGGRVVRGRVWDERANAADQRRGQPHRRLGRLPRRREAVRLHFRCRFRTPVHRPQRLLRREEARGRRSPVQVPLLRRHSAARVHLRGPQNRRRQHPPGHGRVPSGIRHEAGQSPHANPPRRTSLRPPRERRSRRQGRCEGRPWPRPSWRRGCVEHHPIRRPLIRNLSPSHANLPASTNPNPNPVVTRPWRRSWM
jgi:hypothetical protein